MYTDPIATIPAGQPTNSTTGSRAEQPTATAPPARAKIMRIATAASQLLDEIHAQPPDAAARERLRGIDTQLIDELLTELTPDLSGELQRLAAPLTDPARCSDTVLRLAHAQLVGWLHGLLHTATTSPLCAAGDDAPTATSPSDETPAAPSHPSRPHHDPRATTTAPTEDASHQPNSVNRSARRTLITAITRRLAQQRLTAAQAAALLHLTGPQVTQLLHANIDAFTLDELLALLPALDLTLQVVPEPTTT